MSNDPLARRTDEELLLLLREGYKEAMGTLVRRYQRELFGYLRRYVNDEHLAEDIFQLTFVALYAKINQYEKGRPARPWIYAIATNQAIDAMRRVGRRPTVSIESAEVENQEGERRGLCELLESKETNPLEHADLSELRTLVRATVDRLPDFLRVVVILAYYQGLKYQDIADILGIPLGTVKSRLHTALAKLHESWSLVGSVPEL